MRITSSTTILRCQATPRWLFGILTITILFAAGAASAGNQVWTGNGPRAKSVEWIARDPGNTSRMWAATFGAGVYRTLDGGTTWSGSRSGLVNTFVRCVVPNPRFADSLLCGTNDGVHESTDGGLTWRKVLSTNSSVRAIAYHPRTATIFAATYGEGVFKSTNGGKNWFASNGAVSFLVSTRVRDVVLHPTNPLIVYAATGTGGGVERSSNGGVDWSLVPDTTATNGAVEQIQIDRANPLRIYAATLQRGVLKSQDGGNTWARDNNGLPTTRCRALVLADTLRYLGTQANGVFYTTLHDVAWHPINNGLTNLTVDALFAAAATPLTVWAGTDGGGIFKSINRGGSWAQLDGGLLATFGFALAVRPSTGMLYDGTGFGDQFWRSVNQGGTWTRATYLFTHDSERAVVPDPVAPKTVYMTAYGAGVYRSANDGATWVNPDSVTGTLANVFVRPLVAWPGQTGHLFVGAGDGVYESVDGGTTWVARSGGLPVPFSVRSLALVPGSPATLYAGSDTSGVYKSADGGLTWLRRTSGLGNLFVHTLMVDAGNPQIVYAGTETGIYKTTNGAASWSAASVGLTPLAPSVRAIVQDIGHRSSLFAAVMGSGVFESLDGGATWQALFAQVGLPASLTVYTLAIDGVRRTLYAGTDAGVCALSNYPLAVTDAGPSLAAALSLSAWPNPAVQGRTQFRYALSRGEPIRMDIFDVSGARVRTLDRSLSPAPGEHVVNWDGLDGRGRAVPAGVYLVRLQSLDGVCTTRVVVPVR